jgi:hypothetical protein
VGVEVGSVVGSNVVEVIEGDDDGLAVESNETGEYEGWFDGESTQLENVTIGVNVY